MIFGKKEGWKEIDFEKEGEKVMKNNLKEIQNLMMKQMHRLDKGCTKDEIQLEINRSGALSQNAIAYLKSLSIGIKVKEMAKTNSKAEKRILNEIGAISEE